jgi:hypothetical protein
MLEGLNMTQLIGDFRDLQFQIIETEDDKVALNARVELSSTFSNTTDIQLLYWKTGEDQTWVTLKREDENNTFSLDQELNRFLVSGTYEVRSIRATDDLRADASIPYGTTSYVGLHGSMMYELGADFPRNNLAGLSYV